MTATPPPVCIEPDALLRMPEGKHFELIDGVPVEKTMGARASAISARITIRLGTYVLDHDLGDLYDAQTGFRCFPDRPRQVRKPDVAFVAKHRLPDGKPPEGDFLIAPDLAVEVSSPNDLVDELDAKLADYQSAGVPLIWVFYPVSRTVLVLRPDLNTTRLDINGTLTGEDVIPGFEVKVASLFV